MADPSGDPTVIDAVIGAGFPKAGNTMLGQGIIFAGKRLDSTSQEGFAVGQLIRQKLRPEANALLSAGSPVAYLKSHHLKPFNGFPHRDMVNPLKVIRITRNPLDTLLSYVNYTRTEVLNWPGADLPPHLLGFLSVDLGIDITSFTKDQWGLEATLENLREAGHLSKVLASFSRRELVIPPVATKAGSWTENILSWGGSPLDLHTVRYEDFLGDKGSEIRKLAAFLDVDERILAQGFQDQQDSMLRTQATSSPEDLPNQVFFNRAAANYFVEFFDRSSVRNFIDRHWAVVSACGYADWCEFAFNSDSATSKC